MRRAPLPQEKGTKMSPSLSLCLYLSSDCLLTSQWLCYRKKETQKIGISLVSLLLSRLSFVLMANANASAVSGAEARRSHP